MPDFEEMRDAVVGAINHNNHNKYGEPLRLLWCKNCGTRYEVAKVGDDCWGCWSNDSLVDDSGVGNAPS